MSDAQEFAFNLKNALAARLPERPENTGGGIWGVPNNSDPEEMQIIFSETVVAYVNLCFNAENKLQSWSAVLLGLVDRALRGAFAVLSITLIVGLMINDQQLFHAELPMPWYGWLMVGAYGVVALLELLANQAHRLARFGKGNDPRVVKIFSMIGGSDWRNPFETCVQATIVLPVVLVGAAATYAIMVHAVMQLLIWGIEFAWLTIYILGSVSLILSSLMDATRMYTYKRAFYPAQVPEWVIRVASLRVTVGVTFLPVLSVALPFVAWGK